MVREKGYRVPLACFWLVFLAAASLRVTLTSLGPVMSDISENLALSSAVVSFLVTIPVICMGIFALIASPLSHRFGLERVITFSLFLIGVSTITRSYFQSTTWLFLSSFLMGIGIAIAGPLLSGYVKHHFKQRSNVGMIFYTLGISISGVLGTMSSSILNHYLHWEWTSTLQFWALPVLFVSAVWAAFYLFRGGAPANQQAPKAKMPWNQPRAWMLVACFGLQSGLFYTNVAWLLPFLLEKGIDQFHANTLLNLSILNGIIGGFLIPIIVIRLGLRMTSLGAILVTILAVVTLLWGGNNLFLLYVTVGILGILVSSGLFALTMLLPFYEVDDGNAVASWTAMMLFGGYCFAAFIPTILGWLYDLTGTYDTVFLGYLLNAILLGIVFYRFFSTKKG
ncbi:CynX/NimT family MFS transporter [Ignatzschineria cameli]|uniref:MFS transporter n=1 Tax=Ignatzschineria cameli TaxID=2182793 RepID=UPI000D61B69B|nr:MFS transporter [Ignatzschineria cameli]PWD87609.1 hypothetical protein DC080_01980 [Ignatzschineria cameli]